MVTPNCKQWGLVLSICQGITQYYCNIHRKVMYDNPYHKSSVSTCRSQEAREFNAFYLDSCGWAKNLPSKLQNITEKNYDGKNCNCMPPPPLLIFLVYILHDAACMKMQNNVFLRVLQPHTLSRLPWLSGSWGHVTDWTPRPHTYETSIGKTPKTKKKSTKFLMK